MYSDFDAQQPNVTFKQSRIFLKNSFNWGRYCYGWLIDDFDLFLWNLLFSRQTSFFVKKVLNVWFRSILYFVSLTRKLFWSQIFGHLLILHDLNNKSEVWRYNREFYYLYRVLMSISMDLIFGLKAFLKQRVVSWSLRTAEWLWQSLVSVKLSPAAKQL